MLQPVSSISEPSATEPAPSAGIANLPAIAANHLPAQLTDQSLAEQLIHLLATSYVRKEGKFFHVDRPSEAMSRDDVQRSFLHPAQVVNGGNPVPKPVLKQVFDTAITQSNPDQFRSIPVWTGAIISCPGNPNRRIQLESGQFILNSWKEPGYRRLKDIEGFPGPFAVLFHQIFKRENERNRVLDWLAWCLQNEGKRPNWAVMLYSQAKGTGKSTVCRIAARLFGEPRRVCRRLQLLSKVEHHEQDNEQVFPRSARTRCAAGSRQ